MIGEMRKKMRAIVVIPAYEPDEKLIKLAVELVKKSLLVVVVDDGSGKKYLNIFDELTGVKVLRHQKNMGKGAALKTAFRFIKENFNGNDFAVVTADADGQHSPGDIVRVAARTLLDDESLVIGVRNFDGSKVPLRSKLGNKVTLKVFQIISGSDICDTQTGLRGFAATHLDKMLNVPGFRYEYEMNMLMLWAKENRPFSELEIETIYEDNNMRSHFNTFHDSVKIYKEILKFTLSSVLSFCLDYGLYTLQILLGFPLVTSNIVARVISAGFNFFVNKKIVFASDEPLLKELSAYTLLASGSLLVNTLILIGLSSGLGIGAFTGKILTEITMFFFNWLIQKKLIFRQKKRVTYVK